MRIYQILIMIAVLLSACAPKTMETVTQPGETASPTSPPSTNTPLPTETPTFTPLPTDTPPPSPTFTETPTPSITPTPTLTITPTFAFPSVTVNQQAHCRYGPSKAYLHAADLYIGDTGTVRGRFAYSKWLYVKFDKLNYFCWVAPSVVDVVGDISTVKLTESSLPGPSVLYPPVSGVMATRQGDEVTITWDVLNMTEDDDRGYFIEAWVCQDGSYLWWTVSFPDKNSTSYTVKDQAGCPAPSRGKLYGVEKHGYTLPVDIPWP